MRLVLSALVLLALAAPAAAQEPGMVHAVDENGGGYRFVPAKLEVEPGAEIIVMNVGQEPHKIRASDGVSFESPTVEPAGEVRFRAPTEPGEYHYYCPFHAAAGAPIETAMAGLLIVREGGTPAEGTPPTGVVATVPTGDAPSGGGNASPGLAPLGVGVALVGAALLALRRR